MLPPIDDQDQVGGQDSAQPVGNDDAGTLCHHVVQRILNQSFRFAVQAAGGFIQYQDARILEDHACQRDALLLAAAQPIAALADDRIVPIRQRMDELVDIGDPAGRFQLLLAGIQSGILQVGADRIVEEIRFLGDHADLCRQRLKRHVAQVVTVDANDPGRWDRTGGG